MSDSTQAVEGESHFMCGGCRKKFYFRQAGESCLYDTNQNERLGDDEVAKAQVTCPHRLAMQKQSAAA